MKFKRGYYDVFIGACAKYPSRVAVRHYDDGVYKHYTYSELYGVCEYISQTLQQMNCNKGIIGLISERNIIIPCIIAAAHKCSTSFMFLDPLQNLETVTNDIKFTVVVTINNQGVKPKSELNFKKPEKTVSVFNLTINFYNMDSQSTNSNLTDYSFIVSTSGSTGDPKHIQVPIQCIQPNIDDLSTLFNITTKDVIYFSTPLTFDPSMIEILIACLNGASLLIAPENANILFSQDRRNSVTFWQVTPSKFFQLSNHDIRYKILSPHSTLKTLAFGGEPLHALKRLKELKSETNKTRIFTLYGVTEMSCWACVAELDLKKILTDKEIPLGNCLSETKLVVKPIKGNKNTGKIVLVSKTRKCVILNKPLCKEEENSLKFIDTGDIAEIKNGTVYYKGRKDDIVKRFGHKINLQFIEATVMLCPRVKTSSCIWLPKPLLLVVYFSSETLCSQELSDFLKCKLDDKHWPDRIIRVDNLPTNTHGKISKFLLAKMYETLQNLPQSMNSLKAMFIKELQMLMCKNFTYDEIKNNNFFAIGGTSFLAVSMCNKISVSCPQFGKLILPHLLSQKMTIEEILQLAQKEICTDEIKARRKMKRMKFESIMKKAKIETAIQPVQFTVIWSYDTGKCVDASPSLIQIDYKLYVIAGSHSGKVLVTDAISGIIQGMITVKSRVEASVFCYKPENGVTCGVVGSHNGTIVCFTIETCKEIWKISVGSMIKSKATCCNGILYIAAYDGKIRCIDILTGHIRNTLELADQAISADLVLAKNEYVLFGTLSCVCGSIHTATNTLAWRGTLSSPVFASPVLYDNDKYVVFAEVNGEIHCRTVEKGIKIWTFLGARGNIFSSLYFKEIDKVKWQMIFGCHDHNVYSVIIKNFQPSLDWRAQLTSPVYATPCALRDNLVLAASTNGKLSVIGGDNGSIIAEHQFANETFSSPAVCGDYIFIGCRDDHIYALKYNINL